MASEFSIELGGRVWNVQFTPDILKESQGELGAPIVSTIYSGGRMRGFTYEETEKLLYVQIRRQSRRATKDQVNQWLEHALLSGRPLQEFNLVLYAAFNACGLEYKLERPTNEDEDATADANGRPTLEVVRPALEPVNLDAGTSGSPAV